MDPHSPQLGNVLLKLSEENYIQGRHHETQRSLVISATIAISAAIVSLISMDGKISSENDVPLSILLIFVGIFSASLSYKHYERYRFHIERARHYRRALDRMFPDQPLEKLRIDADTAHRNRFRIISRMPLHYWWTTLSIFVTIIGIAMLFVSIFSSASLSR